ncbi:hypothetical protein AVEN_136412-1 [Araneus ventricosus]|uniref:Uncharacterized protein n=1 Tax=Araneus ventricosus TaxID=182803 RepID=A0A4Y2LN03_ARAVE|nr:hypothetical protein AVEN_136412-1 [Araneus ventricosus]
MFSLVRFEPWSVDEDPTFPPNTIVKKLKLPHDGRFKMYQAHIHAGVALEFARQGGTTCCPGIVAPCPLNRFSCCNGFRYVPQVMAWGGIHMRDSV